MSDGRYESQIRRECSGVEVAIRRPPMTWVQLVARLVRRMRLTQLGVEREHLTLEKYELLREAMPACSLVATQGWVEQLRQIKDRDELAQIRQAIAVAESAFLSHWAALEPEVSEREWADDLERQVRRLGADGCSFPPIVAAGAHAALPHARPRPAMLGEGAFILIDWGARWNGYCSDLTRVVPVNRISPKFEKLYDVVLRAQQAAIQTIRPGVPVDQVDRAARQVIEQARLGRRFPHGLGHGIGLEIHESPRLAPGQRQLLKAGMVITVEPGVYLPGWGGIRIEDDVLVTRSGCRLLTTLPREAHPWVVSF
jgi:Xaa-Pro aminopeptidase